MNKLLLSRKECTILKGIAILFIILHNYCHEFGFSVSANEFIWKRSNISLFHERLFSLPSHLLSDFFSYWGHYGIVIFLFISGYGLEIKYNDQKTRKSSVSFIISHYKKLFNLMIVGFIANIIVNKIVIGYYFHDKWTILGQLTLLINIIPNAHINPGQFWYLGMILQLYIIYRILIYERSLYVLYTIMSICIILQLTCQAEGNFIFWLRRNFIGNFFPFAIGILFAKKNIICTPMKTKIKLSIIISLILFIYISNFYYVLWLLTPIGIIILSIIIIKEAKKHKILSYIFYKIGKISSSIFITHSIAHWILLPTDNKKTYLVIYLIIYLGLCIILGYIYNAMLKSKFYQKFSGEKLPNNS